MAGKRIYITIPKRDWLLLQRIGTLDGECAGQAARRMVLGQVYYRLSVDSDLQGYDAEQALLERIELLHGR